MITKCNRDFCKKWLTDCDYHDWDDQEVNFFFYEKFQICLLN